ncbi:molybdate-binding periplasmic protein precursor [Roseovarius sp. A-2]|uniref:molybdate ABC transporter substrate-binding protein n=1 Tax=Roseovarius sp. A-2 TaxID=1570360 RepID=UPI0009B54979|nr:molybdate ABC transporter substrate-binding protein [Roseovarius sp. A-2]GAW33609.1 molybdate-binding periplasmic protein precursor [Roseovarius sp. A-2]
MRFVTLRSCTLPLALGFAVFAPSVARAEVVTVFAAASLTTAMAEIETGFEALTGHDLAVSLAGSSALARQIQQGAPADVFLSANPGWMDTLEIDGLIAQGTRRDLLRNTLVLIAHDAQHPPVEIVPDMDLAAMLGDDRLAMALVEAVPAGIYGKAALESLGQWEATAPRVAQSNNVRGALALVALGEAPYGIVYATDAAVEDAVSVIGTFPAETHPPIVYPMAGIAGHEGAAQSALLDYLQGAEARAAFARQGFAVIAD